MRRLWIVLAACALAFGVGRMLMAAREPVEVAESPWSSESEFLETRSGRVHVSDHGEGPAVLLLHGTGRSLADWQEGTGDLLARRHRVIAIDHYGHGFSDRAHGVRYGSVLWAQQAIDVLDALEIERATVVGHSVGGVVAALVAADHPTRVDHVVTIGTGMAMDPSQIPLFIPIVGELVLGFTAIFGPTHSARHTKRVEAGYAVAGTRAALLTYIRRQYTIDGARLLFGVWRDIQAPLLHVSGSEDQLISSEAAERLSRRTGGRFVRIEGVGHDVHILSPSLLVEEIERFLEDTDGPS